MNKDGIVYVVGTYIETAKKGVVWDVRGVFEDQSDAEKACISSDYFVGPIPINESLPDSRETWPGVYYPKIEGSKL